MTVSRTILALAAAAAIGSGLVWSPLAQAQSGTTAPSASSQAVTPRSDAQVEARITRLHKEMKITKDQESDWNALAQDMRDNARAMSSEIESRNGTKPMSAVDNLKSYAKIADTHADGLKKIVPDFEKLYASMSPAQKKTADTIFNQRVDRRVRSTAPPSSSANHS